MSANPNLSPAALQAGLLMEGAQAHQAMVTENLQRLQAHIRDLDAVVRDEIRRTLLEELHAVSDESRRAAQALQRAGRAAASRLGVLGCVIALLTNLIPAGVMLYLAPSPAELGSLRAQRADLESALARLRQEGARAEWGRCGEERRLCVRVDRKAPHFGEQADYAIVRGY
jgi:hypothetical protein